jgi:hypothetical protein
MADLSLRGLTCIFLEAAAPEENNYKAADAGVRAILAALAAAGGDAEALWIVAKNAHEEAASHPVLSDNVWRHIADSVAAAVVANVREREVEPLRELLCSIGHLLGSLAVHPALGEADLPPRASCIAYADEIGAVLGGDER